MTGNEIKAECDKMYDLIRFANDRLKEFRGMCKHEHTIEGEYEYRVGARFPALICSDCGSVIKSLI